MHLLETNSRFSYLRNSRYASLGKIRDRKSMGNVHERGDSSKEMVIKMCPIISNETFASTM
jgi:hypothetical protein